MPQTPRERIEMARAALAALARLGASSRPTVEEIVAFHELHAEHELAHGNRGRAEAALARARRARALRLRS